MKKPLAIVDVETTGLWAATNRIIEVGLIRVENGQVVEKYEQLINPDRPLPWFITRHTGITSAMVQNAPRFGQIMPDLKRLLKGCVFVAHNVRFDYSFLEQEYHRQGLRFRSPQMCTVELSRQLFPHERYHGLDHIIRRFDIKCPDRHRALNDAEAVWQFIQRVQPRLVSLT